MKHFFLAHGEKIGMGIIALLAGLVIYMSMGLEKLPPDKSPQALNGVTQQVTQKVTDSSWEEALQNVPEEIKLYTPLAAGAQQTITPATYAIDRGGWDPALAPPSSLRKDPVLLPPTDFEGAGITGLFAFMSEEMRKEIALREAEEAARREREMRNEREEALRDAERGRPGRNPPGVGAEGGGYFGGPGQIDPNNKNIREVGVTLRPAGVQVTGQELIEQLSCAVIVAKVPMTQQVEEYKKALAEARGYRPQDDIPNYLGYTVQRAEVIPGKELEWKNITIRNGKDPKKPLGGFVEATIPSIMGDWVAALPDTHDERYSHPFLTFPQPPLVGRDWGNMARHSEVPLASEVNLDESAEEEEDPGLPDGSNPEDLFGATTPGGPGNYAEGPMGRGGYGRPGGYGGAYGGYRGGGEGEFSGGGAARYGGGGEYAGGGYSGGGGVGVPRAYTPKFNEDGEIELEVPFFMFRFFDLSVEPGRRYKYRVRLALTDVNGMQVSTNLEPEVVERLKDKTAQQRAFRFTEWSQPTPTISIPQAGIIQVAEAKPPASSAASEVTARLIVESYGVDPENRSQAIQAYIETDARRGSVMNFFGQEVEKLIQQNRYIEKVEDFNIDTGITVLDIDGGDRYTRELKAPAHVLFMDPTGRMYLRDELDDERNVALHRAIFTPPDNKRGTEEGMQYGGEEGGGRRGGFFGP